MKLFFVPTVFALWGIAVFGGIAQANPALLPKYQQLSLVDSGVADAHEFGNSLAERSTVELLHSHQQPLAAILARLKANPGVTNLHLYSHADAGQLFIGSQTLDIKHLSDEQLSTLAAIGKELGDQGGIYFYGCNFAAGDAGQSLVNKLADASGVDVWASDDITGANELAGDWQLEVASTDATADPIVVEDYQSTLNLIMTPTLDGNILRDLVMDPSNTNVVVTDVEVFGVDGQIATFTNGLSVPGFIAFEEGIMLSTGDAVSIAGPNTADGTGNNVTFLTGADNDPQFNALTSAAQGTFDATYITITFVPQQNTITGSFVFASEEYNEYAPTAGALSAGNTYYDVMAFFVNDINYSLTAAGENVSINTVNETFNSADFVSNDPSDDGNPTPINIASDGFTHRLEWTAPVNIGVPNTIRFGIADGGDATYNSWLLIDKYSFEILQAPANVDLAVDKTDNLTEVVDGNPIAYEIAVTNTGPSPTGREVAIVDTLPAGVTVNGGVAESVIEIGPNAAEWTCLSDAASPQNITCKSIVPIQTNAGNNSTIFGFVTDPISQVIGTTLVNNLVMTSEDIDITTGNNTASDSSIVTASDTAPPVANLSGVPSLISNTDPFTVSLTFNEDVTGVDLTDLSVIGGVASGLTSVDASAYTAIITPDGIADVVVAVVAGAAQDGAGNVNAATATQTAIFEVNAVDLSLLNVPAQSSGSSPYTVTFEFSENVIGFDISDITVINGTATNFVIVDGNTYTADVLADGTGNVELQVVDGAAQDTAGIDQTLAASGTTILNLSAPTVVISSQPDVVNTTNSYLLTVEFSEDVTGFDAVDLSATNATIVAATAIDGNSYTVEVQPDGNGDIAVSIPAGSAIDIASNGNTLSNTATTVYDIAGPQPAITGLPVRINTTAALPMTVTFDEPVTGFDLTDIQVSNGTVANFVAVDSQTFTVGVTPDGVGDVGVTVPIGAAQDTVGNASLIAVPVSVIFDDIAPTLSIALVAGDNIINALEDDTDVIVSGTSAGLEDGQTVTVSINGTNYSDIANSDSWSITLPAAAAQLLDPAEQITANASDLAGNAATTATADVIHDVTAPAEPMVTSLLTNNVQPVLTGTATLVAGDSLQITVDGVTYTDAMGDLVVNPDGTWALTIPATQTLPEGVLEISALVTDASGNTASDQTSNEVVVDLSAPADPLIAPDLITLSDTGGVDTDNVTQDATGEFAVPAGTLTAGDTVTFSADGMASGTTTVLADGSFSADITTLADATYAIQYSVSDPAGNESALSPALSVTVDTVIAVPTIDSPIAIDDVINAAEQTAVLVTGAAEADSVMVVTLSDGINPDVTVQVIADATGIYTLLGNEADIQSLDEGNITITTTSADLAGNTAVSLTMSVTLDVSAPAVPTVASSIQNTNLPIIDGSATLGAGESLSVVVNGVTYTE
ncbi:MAG: choice-of-anchor L domain-containing protein, partial [Granulosicoccaceae bacterium]